MKTMITNWNVRLGDYAAIAFLFAFALTTYEVFMRYFFSAPTFWTLEVALMTSGVAYLLSGPQATALNTHIRIELFIERMPPPLRLWFDRLADLMTAAFGAIIVYSGWLLARPLMEGIERTGSALNSPAPTIIKMIIPIAGMLICIQSLIRLVESVSRQSEDQKRGQNVN